MCMSDFEGVIKRMIEVDGSYLFDVMVSYVEYVLFMVFGGGMFVDIIIMGDGRSLEEKDMKIL